MKMAQIVGVSKWATRFIWAAIVQGFLALIITAIIVLPIITPSASRVIAGGGAGTWFFVGYISYIIVGVMSVALTALFYFYLEGVLKKTYGSIANVLAALHLGLMNIGVIGSTWLLMLAGYAGGAGSLSVQSGGGGLNPGEIHSLIVGYPDPIGYFIIILGLGVLLGGLGYIITYLSKP